MNYSFISDYTFRCHIKYAVTNKKNYSYEQGKKANSNYEEAQTYRRD
jgi:hypothetical protein